MPAQVRRLIARGLPLAFGSAAAYVPSLAHASFLSGDALDTVANWLAWFVLIVMPFVAIAVFLVVHVLPEKIAEKRHHPQKDSIKVLCILSLFFGGMLWPFAWLWAYTRPTMHKAVFGTEKHEDYYVEMAAKARVGALAREEIAHMRFELEAMAAKGALSPALRKLLDDLDAILAAPPQPVPAATPRTERALERATAGEA